MYVCVYMTLYVCVCIIMSVYVVAHNPIPPDPTMTVDNVTQVLNKIPEDEWEGMMSGMGGLGIPQLLCKEILRRYSTDKEQNHACADYYVNYHPQAEWRHLTLKLYWKKEFGVARESKSFMSTGTVVNNIVQLLYSS